ncbi:catalase [Chitinophaga solisilvae]|uniref:catalase n=1 Tax=Chitinophaga solisilvae TaxID=1233460 RepID=UPI00136DEED7|nr:catalase [Chitinophaga solisilvae]
MANPKDPQQDKKTENLAPHTADNADQLLTTNQGLRINDNQHSLKAGERGPSLLEDFILREKITHFDHERIPERVVHARGSGAHGYFQVYEPMGKYTKAGFLNDPSRKTPVFVRFSTVAGSRGSTDLARDARGFAVKFYTDEGNYDLVGNNIPVFFIQDAMKFPDFVHAVKPEPHHEMPQAASAHDTFWDFISLMPESMHMIMWVMSDRAIPRSYRMMEGFGVHTFRFINEAGQSHFVKFHWKPLLGVHAVAWDEALKISGKDPDFHRRDLWNAIESGAFPEYELGVQIVPEEDEHKFPFDLLDPTKIIPEEVVPVQRIGRMVLNRNPDNFFAETEQVAFHPGHLVPGIDFSNDPLLQGRLFSYLDTQLSRLGSPNFHEIPINRPVAPLHNNQRDGHMRQTINRGGTSYEPNTLGGGCPFQAKMADGGFTSHQERVEGHKVRARSRSFFDHFSQAALFYHSQSAPEKTHIVNALRFELGKVTVTDIRIRMLGLLNQVDTSLAAQVAAGLGLEVPATPEQPVNHSIPADGDPEQFQPFTVAQQVTASAALSMAHTVKNTIKSRQIAFLLANGVAAEEVDKMKTALERQGAVVQLVAPHLGAITTDTDKVLEADQSFLTTGSVLFDAVYIPGGAAGTAQLQTHPDALHFIREACRHCKAIAVTGAGATVLEAAFIPPADDPGIITDGHPEAFIAAIAQHRCWDRESQRSIPA